MFTQLFRKWWLFAAGGVLAIVFGILALTRPEQTLQALALVFGAFALVDGIFAAIAGIALHGHIERWWAVLLEGVTGIVIGLLTFFWPNTTALVLLYFIGTWAVITGVFEIVAAIQFRRIIAGEWAFILGGLLSVILGILLFVFPAVGAVSLVWLIGIYAIAAGATEMIFAFRLHSLCLQFDKAIVFAHEVN